MLSGIEIAEAVERHKQWLTVSEGPVPEGKPVIGIEDILSVARQVYDDRPRIVIENFDTTPSHEGGRLNPNSYNLSLANKLLVYQGTCDILRTGHKPTSTSTYMGKTRVDPVSACVQKPLDTRTANATEEIDIPEDGFILRPGVLYLGSTQEWTESYNCIPVIEGRSSIARLGVFVHVTAGFGDSGFQGRWTLEMVVVHPVVVYPGLQICQIAYDTIGRHFPYQSKKYQGQTGVTASRLYTEARLGDEEK